jgi:hypothetical protein
MLEHAGEPPRWRVYRAGRLPLHALRRGATGGHVWGGGGAGRATCGTGGTSAWAEQQAAMPSWRSRARLRAWEAQARWSEDSSARATKVQSNTKKRRRTHLVEGLAGEEEVAPRQPSWASGRSPGCFGFGRWDRQPPGDRGSGSCEHQGEKMGKGERMTVVSRRSHKARRTVCHAHARWAGHAGSPRRGGGFLFLPFL